VALSEPVFKGVLQRVHRDYRAHVNKAARDQDSQKAVAFYHGEEGQWAGLKSYHRCIEQKMPSILVTARVLIESIDK
jgi:hypothetical protein